MKKLLIVVDYQNDFVTGSLSFARAKELEEGICRKIEDTLAQNGDLMFTFDTHGEDYLSTLEGSNLPVEHCLKGSEGWKLYGKVAAYQKDAAACLEKEAFGSCALADYLQDHAYDVVELVGVVSNICVISNAVIAKAALPQAEVIVDAQCTASNDGTLHEKALDVMEGLQIKISNR